MPQFDTASAFDAGLRFDAGPGASAFAKPRPTSKTMNKFKLELRQKTIAEKLALGATHITSMTGNANYPAPGRVPTDAQLATAQAELASASAGVDAAEVAWKQKIQDRDAKEQAWDTVMTSRANFCEAVTPTDIAALASTGFPLRSAPSPVGMLPAPGDLRAEASDQEGQVFLLCNAVTGASSYEWQCREHQDAATFHTIQTSTASRITASGLTPGNVCAFRVRAIGSAGPGAWSDEAVRRVP
jgi:hypothetical protein